MVSRPCSRMMGGCNTPWVVPSGFRRLNFLYGISRWLLNVMDVSVHVSSQVRSSTSLSTSIACTDINRKPIGPCMYVKTYILQIEYEQRASRGWSRDCVI